MLIKRHKKFCLVGQNAYFCAMEKEMIVVFNEIKKEFYIYKDVSGAAAKVHISAGWLRKKLKMGIHRKGDYIIGVGKYEQSTRGGKR